MERSPSWEADRPSASQEIPSILWNPNIHYCLYNSSPDQSERMIALVQSSLPPNSRYLRPSVRMHQSRRTDVKFDARDFDEYLSRNSIFGYNRTNTSDLYEKTLSTFYCFRQRKIATKALSSSEMVSSHYDSRRGKNITRTRHNITL